VIVDWQHHVSPRAVFDMRGGEAGLPLFRNGKISVHLNDLVFQIDRHLEFMAGAGIDACVLSATLESVEQCRITNDYYAGLTREHAGRFFCLSPCLPLRDGALDELVRALDLGLAGVVISPQNDGEMLDSPALWPLYRLMAARRQPIFIHITDVPVKYEAYDAPYNMNIAVTREADLLNNTVRLVLGGVVRAFPDVPFVISHLGGGLAAVLDRLERYVEVRGARFWTDCGGTPPFPAPCIDGFREDFARLYFDMAGYEGRMRAVQCALTAIRPDRLLFGTDYPYNFPTDGRAAARYIEDIRQLGLSPTDTAGILGGTARRLLRVAPPD
jgi:predicted TIM-barrel fold metal-dependent hydrolase